jgi:hypothetical protein
MLDHATGTVDGRIAAASTGRRHRTILANAMDYAIERGPLETNPVKHQAEGDIRIVPTHPELTRLLRHHLANLEAACGPAVGMWI